MVASLSEDARSIWQAGVDAVRSESLMHRAMHRGPESLTICGCEYALDRIGRICVVGAGKAGAGMAAALEEILGPELVDERVTGWINVPADCVRPLRRIHLHAARPAGLNEPTEEGVAGSRQILEIVQNLEHDDLCLVLISGGGSALLPAPVTGISLADKQAVTRFLMKSGANISELNTVRKQLSQINGGGLARAIRAGATLTLIISDVVGDPLDIIGSGPTVADPSTPAQALEVLSRFNAKPPEVPKSVFDVLERRAHAGDGPLPIPGSVSNHVIGNNALAVAAAAQKSTALGYQVEILGSGEQGEANAVGRELAEACLAVRSRSSSGATRHCLISGGEPVVRLTSRESPGKGGRNQQLVLAGMQRLWDESPDGIALLSGGTDGEDGPTDAAGACVDAELIHKARERQLDPADYLERNDAYSFFDPIGGLIKTGPTNTNVMDLRVALVERISAEE